MKVVEKFISINGEGTHAGELAVFIRFKGCNLNCSYCDTDWANEADCSYDEMSPEEIAGYIKSTGAANVTLTGGEPLLQEEMPELLSALCGDVGCVKGDGSTDTPTDVSVEPSPLTHLRVEIETNGSIDIRPYCNEYRPVFTLDYKLPSSGCESRMLTSNFKLLMADDTVKFVCGSEEDLIRAREITEEHGLIGRCNIYLSPVFGQMEPARIVDFMMKHRMNGVRLQLQLHKAIWHPEARGV